MAIARPSVKSGSALVWAARAARRELFRYRFDYPVEAVRSASLPGSLDYHIASDALWLDNLDVDAGGVAMKLYRVHGYQYNPLFVAWWGLVHLRRHLRDAPDRGDGGDLVRRACAAQPVRAHQHGRLPAGGAAAPGRTRR